METCNVISVNKRAIIKAHDLIRIIKHPIRLAMLEELRTRGNSTVTEIYVALRLVQSECSQHLSKLRKVDLVKTERSGKHIRYFINQEELGRITAILEQL